MAGVSESFAERERLSGYSDREESQPERFPGRWRRDNYFGVYDRERLPSPRLCLGPRSFGLSLAFPLP